MASFDEQIEKAVQDRVLPGVVLIAKDKSGKLDYVKVLGNTSLDADAPSQPLSTSSIFTWMSLTKLPTTIAVLQLVESGLLSLDDDLTDPSSSLLPELAPQPVLASLSSSSAEGELRPREGPLTLRHLLSHTSGLAYPFLPGPLMDLFAKKGWSLASRPRTVHEAYAFPLLFDPGQGWAYGAGIDWAGLLLERTVGTSLEEYLRKHLYAPLGLGLTGGNDDGMPPPTFFPTPDDGGERTTVSVSVSARDPATGKMGPAPKEALPPPPTPLKAGEKIGEGASFGGEAASGSVDAYARVLGSLLADDGVLLRPETAKLLFVPQLKAATMGEAAREGLMRELAHPEWIAGVIPPPAEQYDWGFGGLLVDGGDGDGGAHHPDRRKGCVMWGGMYNSSWFLDRAAGLFGIFATQMVPPGDPEVRALTKAFQDEMYSRVKAAAARQ